MVTSLVVKCSKDAKAAPIRVLKFETSGRVQQDRTGLEAVAQLELEGSSGIRFGKSSSWNPLEKVRRKKNQDRRLENSQGKTVYKLAEAKVGLPQK